MLSMAGVGRNVYAEILGRGCMVPEIPCPAPECNGRVQRSHGYYRRYVEGRLFEVRRLICLVCGVTNALLPEDMCAYRDTSLSAIEAAADGGPGPASRAEAAGEGGHEAKRRVRRWGVDGRSRWVTQLVALLAAGPEGWMERVRAVVGAEACALVRLRRWLWSRYVVFLGGPSGLFRLGRPRGRPGAAPNRDW